ncbi:EAL domain-containing protein [Vibrio sp. SCSIO 43136]|uniref:EAL domain-containing protein n=1 Tax=Vibrio sp. SCSIO 43136 TaxID=2819101 RepID=UPI002075F17F|nr:EAL domain-containing protein [Vibrio sp. SCSIO 43136]USD67676.1 EAL domain-containing protein [Vibrio sp. SCSIO 43136]
MNKSMTANRYLKALDTSDIGLWISDSNGKILFSNQAFYQPFALSHLGASAEDWYQFIHPDDRDAFVAQLKTYQANAKLGDEFNYTMRIQNASGKYRWIETQIRCDSDEIGKYFVGSNKDVSTHKKLIRQIEKLAFYNRLTGLPNYSKLERDFNQLEGKFALIRVFRLNYNSEVVRSGLPLVISQIQSNVEAAYKYYADIPMTIYQTNADSYAILISKHMTPQEITEFSTSFKAQLDASILQNEHTSAQVVFGAYLSDARKEDLNLAWALASETCEYAKRHSDNQFAIYDQKVGAKIDRELYIERSLAGAINRQEQTIALQPIINSQSGKVDYFEALSRWYDKQLGQIFPDEYIPVAERKDIIANLGLGVLEKSCQFLVEYQKRWQTPMVVSINVSVVELLKQGFSSQVQMVIDRYNLTKENFIFEVTETVLLEDKAYAIDEIIAMADSGFQFSMDDYGSGHGSILNFLRLPFKGIKIDRMFAWDAKPNSPSYEYLQLLTQMCQKYGVKVTMEGVEDEEMAQRFRDIGVNHLQGYHFSHPLEPAQALKLAP